MSPRGRGIDFEHRFKTSRWAEDLVIRALGQDLGFLTVRIGLSEIQANNLIPGSAQPYKVPDLLTFRLHALTEEERLLLQRTDLSHESHASYGSQGEFEFVIRKALAALEVKFSPYKASEMTQRHWQPRSETQWEQRPLRRAKPPTAPNIWVKEKDLSKLVAWENQFQVPVLIVHLFDQEGFAIALRKIREFNDRLTAHSSQSVKIQMTTGIFKKDQAYERVDAQGARETKTVFMVAPAAAVKAGNVSDVEVSAQLGLSASKKYVAHPLFKGGRLTVSQEFIDLLAGLRR
ncbi:MAG: hypothetical protein AB1411_13575 [Nitrospirota bacterium]